MSRIVINDILIILGLVSLGAGLFLWFGLPQMLTAEGILLLIIGLFAKKG